MNVKGMKCHAMSKSSFASQKILLLFPPLPHENYALRRGRRN